MTEAKIDEAIVRAARLIRSARAGTALTGAGISTPSGIPDFRSPHSGLWAFADPMETASLSAFRTSPERFYDWLRPLAAQVLDAEPNPAHQALSDLQDAGYLRTIITQNIDGLHQKAGSREVYEIHGSASRLTCISCYRQVETTEIIDIYLGERQLPRCPRCGNILKLDVILFDEELPYQTWALAEKASRDCDLMLVIGSSLEVLPVSRLPLNAVENGARLVVINLSETYIDSRADVVIPADVSVVLPKIVELVIHA